tara:strand:+ start:187 stop:723 length:537 start_codon:yes stop_codon:yes gene_type:complete
MNRRDFHKTSGAILLSYFIGGTALSLSPAAAQERHLPFQILTPEEADLLARLGDAIVPGAKAAGLSHYIDHQLSTPSADTMLILKYLGVPAPYIDFYRPALRALKNSLHDTSATGLQAYIAHMTQNNPPDWDKAPPAPFFYFILRSDAIDITYGTREGFEKLDIPYLAHIEPEKRSWT